MVCLSRPYTFIFFKGCLPQILLGPFLNTFFHFILFFPTTQLHQRIPNFQKFYTLQSVFAKILLRIIWSGKMIAIKGCPIYMPNFHRECKLGKSSGLRRKVAWRTRVENFAEILKPLLRLPPKFVQD